MFDAWKLPKGAPFKQIWFATCDVCHDARLGPFTGPQKNDQRAIVEGAGWRYQGDHPMDTCVACIAKENGPTHE